MFSTSSFNSLSSKGSAQVKLPTNLSKLKLEVNYLNDFSEYNIDYNIDYDDSKQKKQADTFSGFNLGNVFSRITASLANGAVAIGTSIVGLAESVFDFGMMGSLGVAARGGRAEIADFLDRESLTLDETRSYWVNEVNPIVGFDFKGKVKSDIYDNNFGKWANENAFKPFKSDGFAYKMIDKTTEVASIVVLSTFTAGTVSPGSLTAVQNISSIASGINKFINNFESDYGKLENKTDIDALNKIYANSGAQGFIEGITWWFTYGAGLNTIGKSDFFANTGVAKTFSKLWSSNKVLDFISNKELTKMGIQFGKTFLQAGSDSLIGGKEVEWNEVTVNAFFNAFVSLVYDKTLSSSINKWIANYLNINNSPPIDKSGASSMPDVEGVNPSDDKISEISKAITDEMISKAAVKSAGTFVKEGYKNFKGLTVEALKFLFSSSNVNYNYGFYK